MCPAPARRPANWNRMTVLGEIRSAATKVAAAHQEWPSVVFRRRVIVGVALLAGAVLLGFSLRSRPGESQFYWLIVATAATWAAAAFVSGPLHLGFVKWRGRNQRPVITGIAVGLALSAIFVAGALVVREIPAVADRITRVLAFADAGPLWVIALIAFTGVAEELFFRGALYTALGSWYPVLVSTGLYVVSTAVSGNSMLGFAALILGTVCALERRATGGVLAPVLTHLVWGLTMVLALPPIFGL
jgi:uncharacterized protein